MRKQIFFTKKEGKAEKTIQQDSNITPNSSNLADESLNENNILITGIKEKSKKLITLNFDLTQKLSENEKNIEELNKDLSALHTKVLSEEENRNRIERLQQKVREMVQLNISLKNNLELLKNDLLQKEAYANALKINLSKRMNEQEVNSQISKATEEYLVQIKDMEKNIGLLKDDIKQKDQHISMLKKSTVKKQYSFFVNEQREKDIQISKLKAELENKSKKIGELENEVSEAGNMSVEDFDRLKHERDKAVKDQLVLGEENKNLSATNEKLVGVIKGAGRHIEQQETKISEQRTLVFNLKSELSRKNKVDVANKMLARKLSEKQAEIQRKGKALESISKSLLQKNKANEELKIDLGKAARALKSMASFNAKISAENLLIKTAISDIKDKYNGSIEAYESKLKDMHDNLVAEHTDKILKMKNIISETIKDKALLESDKSKLKDKLVELTQLRQEMDIKEEYYKQVIMKMSKQELELRAHLELLKKRISH